VNLNEEPASTATLPVDQDPKSQTAVTDGPDGTDGTYGAASGTEQDANDNEIKETSLPAPVETPMNVNRGGADEDPGNNAGVLMALGAMTAVASEVAYQYLSNSAVPHAIEPQIRDKCDGPNGCERPCVMTNVDNVDAAFRDKRYVWVDDHQDHLSVNAKPDRSTSAVDARENFNKQGGFNPNKE